MLSIAMDPSMEEMEESEKGAPSHRVTKAAAIRKPILTAVRKTLHLERWRERTGVFGFCQAKG